MDRIELSTFAGLLEHGHGLAAWCPECRRWASCDLAMLVRNGLGGRDITRCRPTCRLCGSRGEWQVRAPVPALREPQAASTVDGPQKASQSGPRDTIVRFRRPRATEEHRDRCL